MAAKPLKSALRTQDGSSHERLGARPSSAPLIDPTLDDSAPAKALARLNLAVTELKAQAVLPYLQRSVAELHADHHQESAQWAIQALEIDERCALGWQLLGISREQAGDFGSSLKCFESAIELEPDNSDIANDLGRLAYRMGMKDMASRFFSHYLTRNPGSLDGANNLACSLRDQSLFGEAIEMIRPAIYANPESAMLWNTLGSILVEQGDLAEGVTFFDEALRLEPAFAKARYNRGNALMQLGDAPAGLIDCEAAIPGVTLDNEVAMMRLARSTLLVASGRLGEGWDAYEERLSPHFADVTRFLTGQIPWTPQDDLNGKSLLVIGEQGLGDEVMFANVLADVIEALGPEGKLWLAVEPRLQSLFQRSFPEANVTAHATFSVDHRTVRGAPSIEETDPIDLWTPLASPLRRFRRSVEDFPNRPSYLTADPARVEHWRGVLAALDERPTVGVLWKSLKLTAGRQRYFSPFEQWRPVLETPGVRFVNLQYGDCAEELETARKMLGVEIWNPEGIDLKEDLDEVAALACALDLVIGPANATTNIAAACGAPVWLISVPGAWPRLGTDHYPWYPQARVFLPPTFSNWDPVMREVAAALSEAF